MEKRIARCNHLLAKIKRGDEKALEMLFNEYGAFFLHIAKFYLADKNMADDVLSEVFVEIVKTSARTFDENKNGINWIYTIIKRKAYAKNKEPNKVSIDDVENNCFLACVIDDDSSDKLAIKDALAMLSDEENKILYLKFWEGLTVREIAKKFDKPKSNVQYMIDRAIEKLRIYLEGTDNDKE